MPTMKLDDIVKARKTMEAELDEYDADQKKLQTRINKTMGEYRTIAESMDKGRDDIIEQKKQLKDAYDTWDKLAQKLQRIKSDVTTVGKEAQATVSGLGKFSDEATKLSRALASCKGDVGDLKDEDTTLKKLTKSAGRLDADYTNIVQQADGLPKDPVAPPALAA
jgi:chromosome segregation ATPase